MRKAMLSLVWMGLLACNADQTSSSSVSDDQPVFNGGDSGDGGFVAPDKGDVTTEACSDPAALAAAQATLSKIEGLSHRIPNMAHLEVASCSEAESELATETRWVCGVLHYFTTEDAEAAFRATDRLNGSSFSLPEGTKVPLCSRAVQLNPIN